MVVHLAWNITLTNSILYPLEFLKVIIIFLGKSSHYIIFRFHEDVCITAVSYLSCAMKWIKGSGRSKY